MRLPMLKSLLGCGLLAACGWFAWGGGQDTAKPADNRQADREAIKSMLGQFRDAFQKGDAAAAAGFMTNEAELVPAEGDPLKGREAIQKAYAAHFAKGKPPKFKIVPENLRFTSRDTAIEDGQMTVTHEGESPATHGYHILYVREDGKWLISVIKEWPGESGSLDDLNWLIGTWTAKQGDAEVKNTYEWLGNKAYIKASVSVHGKNGTFTAMQIIGVDPESGDYRTWTFEHDGGFGEGTIVREPHHWVFENVAHLAGGALLETSNILVPVDRNTITWQPVNLTLNGETIGNLPPVKLTRVQK